MRSRVMHVHAWHGDAVAAVADAAAAAAAETGEGKASLKEKLR